MAKKKPKNTFTEIDYETTATPKATTADGVPVFCSHDELVGIEKAIPNPKNPNQHSAEQVEMLAKIIEATGWRQPITISKRSGFIVKGHGRLAAAAFKHWKEVPVPRLLLLGWRAGRCTMRLRFVLYRIRFLRTSWIV